MYFFLGTSNAESDIINLTFRNLFELLRKKGPLNPTNVESRLYLYEFINKQCNVKGHNTDNEKEIKNKLLSFTIILNKKWNKYYRNYSKFVQKEDQWLKTVFNFSSKIATDNVGRPAKIFSECSERTKKKKVLPLLKSYTSPELTYAISTKLQKSGKRSTALLLKEANESPTRANKILKVFKNSDSIKPVPFTVDEALAFIIDNNLTKEQYINIRRSSKLRNCDIYPSYDNILLAKEKCYPDNLHITESTCKIPVQNLLDHTINRIFKTNSIATIKSRMSNFEILCKWGCDGSSGQAQYKMKFQSDPSIKISDNDLFMFSLVPIQLRCLIDEEVFVIWQNLRPSSTKFCRPIQFMFMKETMENTKKEVEAIETQIGSLSPTIVTFQDNILSVRHKLIFTMVDGKVNKNNSAIKNF